MRCITPLKRYSVSAALAGMLATIVGCASYAPLPLDNGSAPKQRLDELQQEARPLPAHLGIGDVAVLAVLNNPDLVAARAQRGLAQAQILAAGIAPNPSLSGSYGFVLSGPGTVAALAAGIGQDVKSLVTLSSKRASAGYAAGEIDAKLLWQEWQTIAKARLLTVNLIEGEKRLRLLRQGASELGELLARSRQALAQGDTTLTAWVPDLGAVASAQTQLDDLERQQDTNRRDLNVLLGLAPQAVLPLAQSVDLSPIDADSVREALAGLVDRRPDLIALQLGYRAQEEQVRGAILGQFPALLVGITGGHDNTNVRTLGPQITMDLPLFDRNQGKIAVERAARRQLHDEFGARVSLARAEVESLLEDTVLLQRQYAAKQPQLLELDQAAERAGVAYRAGDLDERTYVDTLSARIFKQQELVVIEQTLLQQQIAMATLVGAGMPAVTLPAQETQS
jgi:outer membrane protein TolC